MTIDRFIRRVFPLALAVAVCGVAIVLVGGFFTRAADADVSVGDRWLTCNDTILHEGESTTWRAHRENLGNFAGDSGEPYFERWRARGKSWGTTDNPAYSEDYSPYWGNGGTKHDSTANSAYHWDFTVRATDDTEVEPIEVAKFDYYESEITHVHETRVWPVSWTNTHSHFASAHDDHPTVCTLRIVDNDAEISVSTPPAGNYFTAGDVIEFTARFGMPVSLDGSKHLEFEMWPDTYTASYVSGNETNQVKFAYTVQPDDLDANGITIKGNAIKGGGGGMWAHIPLGGDRLRLEYFYPRNPSRYTMSDYRVDGSLAAASVDLPLTEPFKPWGIAVDADSNTLYVSATNEGEITNELRVFAYDTATEEEGVYARKPDKDFDRQLGVLELRGISLSDGWLYRVASGNQSIIGWGLDGDWIFTYGENPWIATHEDEADGIQGLWADLSDPANRRMYVVSQDDDSIRAYHYPGDGWTVRHDDDRKIELDDDNSWPRGVWSDGRTIWVADSADDKLYAYVFTPGDTRGDRDEAKDIDLHRANGDPRGLWSDGKRMYVVDKETGRVFHYPYGPLYGNAEPLTPIGLAATAVSHSQIDLEWDPPNDAGSTDVTGYWIEMVEWEEDHSSITSRHDVGSTTEHSFTDLYADSDHTFRVRAYNRHGHGRYSEPVSVRTHAVANRAPICQTTLPLSDWARANSAHVDQPFLRNFSKSRCKDPDRDTLTFTATQGDGTVLPAWLTVSGGTGRYPFFTFRGTPSNDDAASGGVEVKVVATDPDGLSGSITFTIPIHGWVDPNANKPPVVAAAIADQQAHIGDQVSLSLSGTITDPESDTLTYRVEKDSPDGDWLVWDSAGLTLSGTVPASMAQDSAISVTVTATDPDSGSAEYTFTVTSLGEPPTYPTLVSNSGQDAFQNGYSFPGGFTHGTKFTTGSQGALIKTVSVWLMAKKPWAGIGHEPQEAVPDMQIWTDDDGDPGDFVGRLEPPSEISEGENTYRAGSGIALDANADYYLVLNCDDSHCPRPLSITTSDQHDPGGATGWSIGNISEVSRDADYWQRAYHAWCGQGLAQYCDLASDSYTRGFWAGTGLVIRATIAGTASPVGGV